MSTRKIFIGLFASLSIAVFAGQTLSQTRIADRTTETSDWILRRNMTSEQINKEQQKRSRQLQMQNKKRIEQLRKQSRSESEKKIAESMMEALRATEQQWKIIKPKFEKVRDLAGRANVSIGTVSYGSGGSLYAGGSSGGGGRGYAAGGGSGYAAGSGGGYAAGGGSSSGARSGNTNNRSQEGWKWSKAWEKKTPGELTKGERICEELLELLEDKGSKQEEIEQKVEALREVRKEAGKELAKAQQELRKVLTFRQEATLVLMRYLD